MLRRLTLSVMLVVAGFVAGLVVTGRMRTAADSRAAERSPAPAGAPEPRVPAAPAPASAQHAWTRRRTIRRRARLHPHRRPGGQRRRQHFVAAGRPHAATRRSPTIRSSATSSATTTKCSASRDRRSLSLGSGVIISADGYVVTNNHVVGENVREITIALPDKREIKGKVIGTDPTTDIALLKIDVDRPAGRRRGATRAS